MATVLQREGVPSVPDAPAGPSRAPSDRRAMVALFAVAAGLFLLLQSGSITVSDGRSMYETTRAMVEHRSLDIGPELGVAGRDGGHYSRYGIALPVVSMVPYLIAKPAAALVGGARADLITQAAVATTMPLIGAGLVVAMFALARRLGAGRRAALLVSLGGVVGTFALPYTKSFFSEPLAALAIVAAIERALADRYRASTLWIVVAFLTRPQSLAFVPVLAIVMMRRGGRRAAIEAAPAGAAGVLLLCAYNVARFGDALSFGYADAPGFTAPFWTAARGLILDADKGVIFFAPVVLLAPFALRALWRSSRDAVTLLTLNLVFTFVLAAGWWSWAGGWSWGPRLVLPGVLPLLCAIGPWLERSDARRKAVVVALAAGLLVSASAMLVSQRTQQLDPGRDAPSIARQYALVMPVARYTAHNFRARGAGDARRYLDLWQVNVGGVMGGIGLAGAAAGSIVLGGLTLVAASRLRRELD
jgi:hypothetical protein